MLDELVVLSLEQWDDVWRRNQFFVDALLGRNPGLRVLFVEPPADPIHDIAQRRRPTFSRLRSLREDGRLLAYVRVAGSPLDLEEQLLQGGYARTLEIAPNIDRALRYRVVEQAARTAGHGLWSACPQA